MRRRRTAAPTADVRALLLRRPGQVSRRPGYSRRPHSEAHWQCPFLLRAKWALGSSGAPMGFGNAALLQLLYPKLWLMAIATISLCTGDAPGGAVSVWMVLFFVVMTLAGMLLYLKLGGVLRSLSSAPRTRVLANRSLAALTAISAVMLLVPA